MTPTELSIHTLRPVDDDFRDTPRHDATIEQNGSEYLVTINHAVFVALSLAQAEAFANRLRGRVR